MKQLSLFEQKKRFEKDFEDHIDSIWGVVKNPETKSMIFDLIPHSLKMTQDVRNFMRVMHKRMYEGPEITARQQEFIKSLWLKHCAS